MDATATLIFFKVGNKQDYSSVQIRIIGGFIKMN